MTASVRTGTGDLLGETMTTTVLVLGGGPDAEREVSLISSRAVAEALEAAGYRVEYRVIERVSGAELKALKGEVIFPVLHGGWGEGGPLQELLETDGRPFVGCRAAAARLAMDKLGTKLVAARLGVPSAEAIALNTRDEGCPLPLPVVIKPVHEGSSVGVHICRTPAEWREAVAAVRADMREHAGRTYMAERAIFGPGGKGRARELTVGWLDGRALPIVEIKPAVEFYDYAAKYTRDDTQYVVGPALPGALAETMAQRALALARGMGLRHLSRIDFLLEERADGSAEAWLLEVNTMPGFTGHSLLPMAANATGLAMPALCGRLVELARG